MMKKCKITNLTNGIIYGVTKDPIREGKVLELNSGQILTCLMEASVDEILNDGTLVRLNKSNYNTNNDYKKIHVQDEVQNVEISKIENISETTNKEEEKKEEVPEELVKEDVEDKKEEVIDEEKKEEKQNNNYQKNNKKKNR